jgi:hypothetical protein
MTVNSTSFRTIQANEESVSSSAGFWIFKEPGFANSRLRLREGCTM